MKKLFSFLVVFILVACSKDPVIYTLTATANPAEGGTVSPSSQQYDSGDVATVTANPSAEYVFQSWSGSASGSSPSTTVTMDSDKAVVANFVKKKYALTVNTEGEGSVTEKVIKAGVATDYTSGTVVELTAVPEGEWLFVEWTGDLTGSENPKEITIDKAKTVTAVFVKKQYPLTIEIEGEGTVTETVIKQGLATDYNSGTIVELTAEPTGDWEFVEWTGDITSTENPVQITIDGPKTVKVKFNQSKFTFKYNEITLIDNQLSDIRYLHPTISDVTGYTHYSSSNNDNFMLFFGNIYNEDSYSNISQVDPAPSVILKKSDGKWNFERIDYTLKFWTARNFKILGNYITVGDGNEIGSDGRDWSGDIWQAEILSDGNLNWNRVTNDNTRGYFHGATAGDLNGDGLQDAGGTPGIDHSGINIFIQKSDGSFERQDGILNYNASTPFTLDFHDFDKDGISEIVTADYGGGNVPDDDDHEIRVYKYDNSTEKFELSFTDNEPNFYSWGKGATSIICADLNNDNHDEIIVAREDGARGFEVWLNNGDETFSPHFSHEFENLDFQEFKIFDANNDGFNDILLNGYGYKKDFRINATNNSNPDGSDGVILNKLIWLNNGDATFEYYNENDLSFIGPQPWFLHPYLDNGVLHFFGIYDSDLEYQSNGLKAYTWDFKIDINN
jgi:hypothetical protein